jgi:hypothetical protein
MSIVDRCISGGRVSRSAEPKLFVDATHMIVLTVLHLLHLTVRLA